MIIDKISNIERYEPLIAKSLIQQIKDAYFTNSIENNKNISIFEYHSEKVVSKPIFECHYAHIDFQIVLEGEEYMYVADKLNVKVISDINYEEDYQLFEASTYSKLIIQKGDFIVFFPKEIHSPKHYFNQTKVKRIVIKEEI